MSIDTSPNVAIDESVSPPHRRGTMLPILQDLANKKLEALRLGKFEFAQSLKENHGNVYAILTGTKTLPLNHIDHWAKHLHIAKDTAEYREFVAAAHWSKLKSRKLLAPSIKFIENFMRNMESELRDSSRLRQGFTTQASNLATENVELGARILALEAEIAELKRKLGH